MSVDSRWPWNLLRYAVLAACCVGIAFAQPGQATDPLQVPDTAAPTFTVFGSREGLGDEVWSTVGFGPDGHVWAGSASGLARFDGYRWVGQPRLPMGSLVRDMATDGHGNLWAIFEREGLVRFDGQTWQQVGPKRFYQRFSTVRSGDGVEIWAAHADGLSRLDDDGGWVEDSGNATLRAGPTVAFARTRTLFGEKRDWLASANNGLWFRRSGPTPGPWQPFDQPGMRSMSLTDLLVASDAGGEELWAVSYGSGIARIRDDGTRVWRAGDQALPTEAVYSAVETRSATGERSVWMASRGGLLRFVGDRVTVFDRRHGLPSNAVRGLKVQRGGDGTESLWLATEGGLARATLADSPWQTVSLMGANENGIFGVLVEANGRGGERLWAGSAKEGLAMLEDGQWRSFTHANSGLPAQAVRGLWRLPGADGRDHRVVAMVGAPLQEITDSLDIRPLATPWPITPDASVNHLIARRLDGKVEWWAATTNSGVHRLRDGVWQAFPIPGGEAPAAVRWLLEQIDREGRSWLWAADAMGIARFDGDRWERLPSSLGLPSNGFRSLAIHPQGGVPVMWASSAHQGILRLDVSDPRQPRPLSDDGLPAPPDPIVYSILRDSQERLYVCTNNGVQQLTPQAGGGYRERVFRRRDGLVHDECNTNSQFIDSRDRYWVGTLGGLGLFDPNAQAAVAAAQAKPLHFTEVRVDGEAQALALAGDQRLTFPSSLYDLRVEYSLLVGRREGESVYRTQLIGVDREPVGWTAERSRSFSKLPPGDYRFRVEARDYTGTPAVPRELALTVTPLWWQQRWLQLLAAALGLLSAWALARSYNRGLRERAIALRQQVAMRTQDLHEANLRLTELSYLDPLTGIANRRRLLEAIGTAMARAKEQGKPVGLIVADVDHFKSYNDRFGHLAGDAALRAIASAMDSAMREQDLVARFGGEEFACLMVDADLATVGRVAERMRALVEALPPRSLGNDSQTLTISAGIVSVVPQEGQLPEALLHAADLGLYAAKAAGRNLVCPAPQAPC